MLHRGFYGLALVSMLWFTGCGDDAVSPDPAGSTPTPIDQGSLEAESEQAVIEPSSVGLGEPLRGLPSDLLARFEVGKENLEAVDTPAEGLGPVFNAASFAASPDQGGIGGR